MSPNARVFYRVEGEGDPVLFVGGPHLDHTYLRDAGTWFSGFTRVYIDLSGAGRSEPRGRELTHATWVDDIEWVRRQIGADQLLLFGHSYGGFLCQEYLVRHSEHIRAAILCCTAPAFEYAEAVVANALGRNNPEAATALQEGLSRPATSDRELEATWRAVLPLYFAGTVSTAELDRLSEGRCSAMAFNAAHFGCLQQFDVRAQLPDVATPLLLLSGSDDFMCPAEFGAERIRALAPSCSSHEFPNAGHFPWIEQPTEFQRVVTKWLQHMTTTAGSDSGP